MDNGATVCVSIATNCFHVARVLSDRLARNRRPDQAAIQSLAPLLLNESKMRNYHFQDHISHSYDNSVNVAKNYYPTSLQVSWGNQRSIRIQSGKIKSKLFITFNICVIDMQCVSAVDDVLRIKNPPYNLALNRTGLSNQTKMDDTHFYVRTVKKPRQVRFEGKYIRHELTIRSIHE